MTINVGIGKSTIKDSFKAGKQAAELALKDLGDEKAQVLIVFGSPKFKQQKLLDGITSITQRTPMIGGTSAGEISTFGVSIHSVIILALSADKISFATALGKNIQKNEFKAGEQAAKKLLYKIPKSSAKSMIIFPDGLSGDGSLIIKGCQSVLGESFEIVGGALGDETDFKQTYQYYDGEIYQDSIPSLMIGGNAVTASGVRSGWKSIGNRIKVTKAKGNVVYEFDNVPALEYYEQCLGPKRAKKLPSIGLEYPIGIIDKHAPLNHKEAYFQLRSPLAIDKKKKTISFAAAIKEGQEVTLTAASRNAVINGSALAAKQTKEILGGVKPDLIMMFDCIGRRLVLGKRVQEEVNAIQKVLGKKTPLIGFFTYGEIGPIDKRRKGLKETRWHNQTTIIFALGEK